MVGKNRFGLAGKTALITGAAQGHGYEAAQVLSQEGMTVLITDIQKEKGENAAEQIRKDGGEADFFYADLSSAKSVQSMFKQISAKHQSIDLLVNNAYAKTKSSSEELSTEDWDFCLKVNLSGPFYCSREVIPVMAEAGRGCIINISSVLDTRIVADQSADYHVAKAGLSHLTRYLASIAGPKGVRVNGISLGFILKKEDIPRYEADKDWKQRWEWCHPLKRVGYSEDVTNAILFLASDFSSFITGQNLVLDGGISVTESGALLVKHAKETG